MTFNNKVKILLFKLSFNDAYVLSQTRTITIVASTQ